MADSDGLDEVRADLAWRVELNRNSVELDAEAIEALLASQQPEGTLSWMVACDGNWVLDDAGSDAAAADWLREMVNLIRGVVAEFDAQ
ncbi:hypothetical protein [Nocardia sp. NPDC058666]|uniref:hypothetical protein n=1 Tax=Nocardia sp. NPDC058666 TaxID=3346587 RepID=UPI003664F770